MVTDPIQPPYIGSVKEGLHAQFTKGTLSQVAKIIIFYIIII